MIAPMKNVPQNSGIEPNAPDEPAWSARIAVCGLHSSAEQEVDASGYEPEEAQAFEHQRQEDAERRQDRDQRGREQHDHHPALDRRCARGSRGALRRSASSRSAERDEDGDTRRRSARSAPPPRGRAGRGSANSGLKPCSRSPWAISRASDRIALALHRRSREAPGPRGSRAPPGRPAATASAPRRRAAAAPGSPPTEPHRRRDRPAASGAGPPARSRRRAGIAEPAGRQGDRAGSRRSARPRLMSPAAPAYFRPAGSSGLSSVACLRCSSRHRRRRTAPGRAARAGRPCPTSSHMPRRSRAASAWPRMCSPLR